ncbi:MAG: IS481 family transposase, partial [Pseudomonadales bacterium]|nr:IS481 family transposase [Pseudomonadales bacterium]
MDKEVKARLRWVKMYEITGNAGLTCRRCGISRP